MKTVQSRPARSTGAGSSRRGPGRWPPPRTLGDGQPAAAQPSLKSKRAAELPKRPLGKTGASVSILSLGTWMSPGGGRLLRFAWANGVRYVDTAKSYGSEPMIGNWLNAMPVPRKDLFLVTKDQPEHAPTAHLATGRAAGGAPDRLCGPDLPPRPGRQELRPGMRMGHEPGIQGNGRCDPQVGQGQVRRVLDPSSGAAPLAPGRRARRVRRRNHAPEQPVDCPERRR